MNLYVVFAFLTFFIFLILLFLVVFWVIRVYNTLVSYRELVRNAMAQIGAQTESRWDALTTLIDASKEYANYEADTLKNIVKERKQITQVSSVDDVEADTSNYMSVFSRLLAVAENYPNLKASEIYASTMASLNMYESNVRLSRMSYNDTVTKLNREIQTFPINLIAGILGFRQEKYFEATSEKKDMPMWKPD